MKEELILEPDGNQSKEYGGFVSWLVFTIKGFVFPCFSPSYYKTASRRNLFGVITFFLMFAFVITIVPTIRLVIDMNRVGTEIKGVYDRGDFPTITIKDGVAQVDGPQPLVMEENRSIVAIDTTGEITEIDTRAYSQGLLLTRTELHFVNEDGYQTFPLIQLNDSFGNPIVLDKTQVLFLWESITLWITIVAYVGILIWNSIVKIAYLALLGLIIWAIVLQIKKGTGFRLVLITGILANVPVTYLYFILNLVNISFFTMYTLLLIAVWLLALWLVLKVNKVDDTNKPIVTIS